MLFWRLFTPELSFQFGQNNLSLEIWLLGIVLGTRVASLPFCLQLLVGSFLVGGILATMTFDVDGFAQRPTMDKLQ